MEASIARKQTVSDITPTRASNGKRDESGRRTVYARLSVADAALTRLLSVSGSQTDFVLASADGSTTVRVGLAVTSVPAAALVLGKEGVVLDWSSSTIMRGATRASLTRMELRLLVILMDHAPAPAPREQLIERMWPSHSPHGGGPDRDAALPVWICALRRRFAAIGLPHAIRTVRSTGYCLSL